MFKKMTLISVSLLLLHSAITLADDSTETMEQNRTEMQLRMQSMTTEERALYKELNGNGEGSGQMNRYGQGNSEGSGQKNRYGQGNGEGKGQMNRYGQGNSDSAAQGGGAGYGSGYGSRSGGSGGGKGRGH
jgi:hypothetical protein